MTQYYKMPGFTLANANLSTKVLLSLFQISVALGLWVAVLQSFDRVGTSAQSAAEWVLGNEMDFEATEIKVEKSYRELLAITHEHALSLPILIFVLLHLVALCTVGERFKIVLYVATFSGYFASLAGMWLTASAGAGWTTLTRLGGVAMTLTLSLSILLTLHEMWLARALRRRRGRGEPKAPDPLFPKRRET